MAYDYQDILHYKHRQTVWDLWVSNPIKSYYMTYLPLPLNSIHQILIINTHPFHILFFEPFNDFIRANFPIKVFYKLIHIKYSVFISLVGILYHLDLRIIHFWLELHLAVMFLGYILLIFSFLNFQNLQNYWIINFPL